MYKKKKNKKNVKKFRKNFNTRNIRAKQTYSTDEIASLLNIHLSTVHAWYKTGLRTIDLHKPHIVFGQDLIEFLKARSSSKKHPCAPNEMFCCKCQKQSRPKDNIVSMSITRARTIIAGFCKTCSTKINKAISPQKIDLFKKIFIIQAVYGEDLIECNKTCAIAKKNIGETNG